METISATDSLVNLRDIKPENFESILQNIQEQYKIQLRAKDKEIEQYRQQINHLREMEWLVFFWFSFYFYRVMSDRKSLILVSILL